MKKQLRITIAALSIFLLAGTSIVHAAKFYKWVDENGVTHYDNKPPKDSSTEASEVMVFTGNRDQQRAAAENHAASRAAALKALDEPSEGEKDANTQKAEEIIRQTCEAHRKNLEKLKSGQRVRTTDPETGEEIWMDDKALAAAIATTEAELAKCNDQSL